MERKRGNPREPKRRPQATLAASSDEDVTWRTESVRQSTVAVDGSFSPGARGSGFGDLCGGSFARELLRRRRREWCVQPLPPVARLLATSLLCVNVRGPLRPETSDSVRTFAVLARERHERVPRLWGPNPTQHINLVSGFRFKFWTCCLFAWTNVAAATALP